MPTRDDALPVTMRALVLRAFHEMEVDERAVPSLEPGHVLVEVAATGICGSDLHGYTGENGRRVPGQVMGHETAGRIAACGDGVSGLEIGEAVTFDPLVIPDEDREAYSGREQHSPRRRVIGVDPSWSAAFAEFVLVPAANVVSLDGLEPVEYGALIEPLAVALHATRRVGVGPDDRLLILGGGPIGQSAVLAAQMAGVSRIIVSEIGAGRRDLCRSLGATVVDPSSDDLVEHLLAEWGATADVTIDAVGLSATVADAIRATRAGGMIGLVGMGSRRLDVDAYRISTEERTIIGSFCYSHADFEDAAGWVREHPERLAALVSEVTPLSGASAAFRSMAAGADIPGKVLISFDREAR